MRPEKMIKGRKRHILTDTIGRRVGMIVHPANVQDRDGAPDHQKANCAAVKGRCRQFVLSGQGAHHVGEVFSTVVSGRWHMRDPNDASAGYDCVGVKN